MVHLAWMIQPALPIMDVERARRELGWRPQHPALEAVAELIEGLGHHEGLPTPPLEGRVIEHAEC